MAQLRSDILCKRKREDTEISEKQYKRMHIAEPIQECQIDENEQNEEEEQDEFTFNAFDISDTEELEETSIDESNENNNKVNNTFEDANNNVLNSEQWAKMIENWIEMVNTESYSDNNNENVIDEDYDFEAGGHDTHPADNQLAKWKLLDLFDESLEAPVYIGSMINFD
jgi:hypothetical protein